MSAVMMFIFLKNRGFFQIPAAASAERRNGVIAFLDHAGQTVQTFETARVEAYTADPDIIGAMKAEFGEPTDVIT